MKIFKFSVRSGNFRSFNVRTTTLMNRTDKDDS